MDIQLLIWWSVIYHPQWMKYMVWFVLSFLFAHIIVLMTNVHNIVLLYIIMSILLLDNK